MLGRTDQYVAAFSGGVGLPALRAEDVRPSPVRQSHDVIHQGRFLGGQGHRRNDQFEPSDVRGQEIVRTRGQLETEDSRGVE
jgi:hypothetical protein